MEKALRARQHKQPVETISHLKRAILIDPEFTAARNNLAIEYYNMSNPEPGIEQLEEAIKIDPYHPALFMNLAIGYKLIDQLDEAERAARASVGLDPTDARPSMVLGLVLVAEGRFSPEALRCFQQARDKFPLAHLFAGRVFIEQGRSEGARSELQTYLASGEPEFRENAIEWLHFLESHERKSAPLITH
jgi:tetratricopeptide (TPR) repeat protein